MNEPYRILFSPAALDDMKSTYAYLAYQLKAPDTAKNLIQRINDEIFALDFMPFRYEQVDWEPWKSMGMRKMPVNNFVVFYLVNPAAMTVTISRIVYGGSDLQRIATTQ